MGPAGSGRNSVHVASNVLVSGFSPLQDQVETRLAFAVQDKRRIVNGLRPASGKNLVQVIAQTFVVLKDVFGALGVVLERDAHTFMNVADDFQTFAYRPGIELDSWKDRRVRTKVDGRSGAPRGACLLQRPCRLAAPEHHFPERPVTFDAGP